MNKIQLSETEQKIFDILIAVVRDYQPTMVLRAAGGWVRDKLMGKESKDVDIALSSCSGQEFANLVCKWMQEHGMETSGVGLIESNPDQSKHLETATTFILGLPIDFVNLRTETYTETSRIPTIQIGTPEEDASRRDLTINALFYNISTGEVEDFTGQGLKDLEAGIIRTPLEPVLTFRDDPLRILRAIRFACRYGFAIDKALLDAAQRPDVREALAKKVSRERIGSELKGIFRGRDPARALDLIYCLGLREIVFRKPEGVCDWDMDQRSPHHDLLVWHHLVKVVRTLTGLLDERDVGEYDRMVLLFAAFLHDTGKLDPKIQEEKEDNGILKVSYKGHEESSKVIAEHILRDLKFSVDETRDIVSLFDPAGRAEQITRDAGKPSRRTMGRFVRSIGNRWRLAILLAMADDASKRRNVVQTEKYEMYHELVSIIESMNLEKAHEVRPLVNGNELMNLLSLKPGKIVGEITAALIDWQLSNPEATKEEAMAWLQENHRSE